MKNGFKVMDSDLHTMEPDGLWERYLEEPFKKFAPKLVRGTAHAPNQPIIKIGDLELGEMSKRERTAVVGMNLQRRAFARSPPYQGPLHSASTLPDRLILWTRPSSKTDAPRAPPTSSESGFRENCLQAVWHGECVTPPEPCPGTRNRVRWADSSLGAQ